MTSIYLSVVREECQALIVQTPYTVPISMKVYCRGIISRAMSMQLTAPGFVIISLLHVCTCCLQGHTDLSLLTSIGPFGKYSHINYFFKEVKGC